VRKSSNASYVNNDAIVQIVAIRYPTDARLVRPLAGASVRTSVDARAVVQVELSEGGPPLGGGSRPLRPRPADEAVKRVHPQTADQSWSCHPGIGAKGRP